MITLKPLTYDTYNFFKELDKEIEFMRLHNPNDEIEIIMRGETYWDLSDFFYRDTYKGIEINYDETLPEDKVDVRIKTARNDLTTNRFVRVE